MQKIQCGNLMVAFSEASDKVMDFRFGEKEESIKNRKKFFAKINLNLDNCVAMSVEHKDKIAIVEEADIGKGMFEIESALHVDALITNIKRIGLLLFTADCLPMAICDPINCAVALVHLGWKPTNLKLGQKAVKKMVELYGSNVENLKVFIGPYIHQVSYKFKSPVQEKMDEWKPFLKKFSDGQIGIDLAGYNKQQLLDVGLLAKNIQISAINTAKDEDYPSHYRSERTGENERRFAAVVKMD